MFAGQTSKREIWKAIGCFDFDMDAAEGVMVQDQLAAITTTAIFVMKVNTHDSEWAQARKPPDLSVLFDLHYCRAADHASPLGWQVILSLGAARVTSEGPAWISTPE